MSNLAEEFEERAKFKKSDDNRLNQIFQTAGSAGNNSDELAKILGTLDYLVQVFGWNSLETKDGKPINTPLSKFTSILSQYQGSVDTKYHNDFKDVLIAEEIVRRQQERKGLSILQQ